MADIVVAGCFVVLALAHSILGEQGVIRPFVASRWSGPGLPARPAGRLMRLAWHLTSVAWLGLAAIILGAEPAAVVGFIAGTSAVLGVVLLRGHFAWALFVVAAMAAGIRTGFLTDAALSVLGWIGVGVLLAAAGVHAYWAAGGRRWADDVVPVEETGEPTFVPSAAMSVAVAAAMVVLAVAMTALLLGWSWTVAGLDIRRWLVVGGVVVLAARAIGDGRRVGFTKSDHASGFGIRDDTIYTPLVTALALAGSAALLA